MDVGAWLRKLGLGQYEAAFRDNEIDCEVLPDLTAEDLKDLGVAIVGHRREILTAIAELHAASSARAEGVNPVPTQRHVPVGARPSIIALIRSVTYARSPSISVSGRGGSNA